MSLAVCLLAYSLLVLTSGPALLARATRPGVAPQYGMAAWLVAMLTVLGSWGMAVLAVGDELLRASGHVDGLLGGCIAALAALAGGGSVAQVAVAVAVALTALGAALVGARTVAALYRARQHTRRHADAALLAARGAPRGPGGALIIDAAHRCVYCLPGRANTIVITRPALEALDDAQLAAVLAHERAHLTGRHHQLLAFTTALARIMPGARLFTQGAAEIARLAELAADDTAARGHGRDTVVDALVALTAPPQPPHLMAPALGATGTGVAERVERLLFPPRPVRAHWARTLVSTALALGPLTMTALILTQPSCTPFLF